MDYYTQILRDITLSDRRFGQIYDISSDKLFK